ncbi:MAG: DUF2190 family protein [Victivallaceae bacterium]|jgi:predicted RecA/RadA family phage recombinase
MIINRQENKRVDHTPLLLLAAGVMVVIGSKIGYTTRECPAGELGSIVTDGLADVPKTATAPDVYEDWADGENVYYDESAKTFTTEDTGNVAVGYCDGGSDTGSAIGRIVFNPPLRADNAGASPSGSDSGSGE